MEMHLACAAQTREQPKGPIQPQHFGRTKWSAPILKGSPSIDTFAVKHPYQPVGNGSRNHDIKKKKNKNKQKTISKFGVFSSHLSVEKNDAAITSAKLTRIVQRLVAKITRHFRQPK